MSKITLADLTAEPTTVELFGSEYRVLAMTRSTQKKFEAAEKTLEGLENEADSDKAVTTLAGVIDSLLAPVESGPAAKKVIADAWKRDELSLGQLRALNNRVQEASLARPT